MSDETITFLVLGASSPSSSGTRCRSRVVAIGVALSLWATDVLTLDQSLAGFGDPTVLFIASLFVVSEALDASGVTAWVGQQLVGASGASRTRLLVLTMLRVAGLTALITPNGSVAALLPVIVLMAVRMKRSPSQLLMPLAFAAHAGVLLVLTASPVNVVVSEAADDAGVGRVRLLRVRARRRSAARRLDRDGRALRRAAGPRPQPAGDQARLQRACPDARRALRARRRARRRCSRRAPASRRS